MASFVKEEESSKKMKLVSNVEKKDVNVHIPKVYIVELEEICEDTFYFATNCHIFGVFSKNISIHYRHANDFIHK